ncbi:MAG: hypothetical protein AAGL98_00605 [Planctomycetota bacterium]
MAAERKDVMISARVPKPLVARADFIARNIDSDGLRNRSLIVQAALEAFLPVQEQRLRDLGIIPKK